MNLCPILLAGETLDDRRQAEDMIVGILVRLPVRSLMRFRCVSKSWFVLIKSPAFCDNHFNRFGTNDSLLLVRRYLPTPKDKDILSFHNTDSLEPEQVWPNLQIPFLEEIRSNDNQPYIPEYVNVYGPCNGLLCICYEECVIFCNPALREFKQLPHCPFACPKGHYDIILIQGFGCTCTQDFKVVVVRSIKSDDDYSVTVPYFIVHLYKSSTNSWKNIDGDALMVDNFYPYLRSGLFFNDICHWNVSNSNSCNPDVMLTFKISTEVFGQLEYPHCLEELSGYFLCLLVINKYLGMVRYKGYMIEPQLIDIWVMEKYGVRESWTKTLVVGPYQVIHSFVPWKNDEWLLVENSNGQLATCALYRNESKRFQIYGAEKTLKSLIYKESLTSLNQVVRGKPVLEL